MPDRIEPVEIVTVDVKAVARGYRVSTLLRSDVVNDRNEEIGTIDDIVIGRDDRVLFVVLQVGGFLGIGGRLVAIPYESLRLDDSGGETKIMLPGATRRTREIAGVRVLSCDPGPARDDASAAFGACDRPSPAPWRRRSAPSTTRPRSTLWSLPRPHSYAMSPTRCPASRASASGRRTHP